MGTAVLLILAKLVAWLMTVPGVRGVHGLRTRQSGHELHLELDDAMSLANAHCIALNAEKAIRAQFPDADIMIHQDPVRSVGYAVRTLRAQMARRPG